MKTEQRKKEDRDLLERFVKFRKLLKQEIPLEHVLQVFINEKLIDPKPKNFTIKQVAKGLEDLQKEIELLKSKIN